MFRPGATVIVKGTQERGLLLHVHNGRFAVSKDFVPWGYRTYPEEDLELAPKVDRAAEGFSLQEDLLPIAYGLHPVPNLIIQEDLPYAVSRLTLGGSGPSTTYVGSAKTLDTPNGQWARFFFFKTQKGQYDGQGLVILYSSGKGQIASFAVCKHEGVTHADARPIRGWHPAHCKLCGLDMTVDSGD